jgi:RNA polymerase sigma-70 factor, ECF subfamily
MRKNFSFSSGELVDPATDALKLIGFSQQGDRDAFACFYETYFDRIHRYVYYRVGDHDLAEDITSHVFLKAWEKLPAYQAGKSPILAWLYRIAHNAVIDQYRTRKVSIPLDAASPVELSQEDGIDEKMDLQFKSQKLREALGQLTDMQQQVLILKFMSGLSTPEIAQKLGKQLGAVRALQMRGLQELAKCPALQREQIYGQ